MTPLPPENICEELAELIDSGLVPPAIAPLPSGFWDEERPTDPKGSVRGAIIEERESEGFHPAPVE